MKTSSTYKLRVLRAALKKGHVGYIRVDGVPEELTVRECRSLNHSLELKLDRNRGFIVIDPDDLLLVRVHELPSPADEEAF